MRGDVLITSSVLILILLVLRRVFRGVVSRRLQYALWGLVLIRLLVPDSILDLPHTDFSVLTATRPVQEAVVHRANYHAFYSDPVREMTPEALLEHNIAVEQVPTADDGSAMILAPPPEPENRVWPPPEQGFLVRDAETDAVTLYAHMAVGPWEILDTIWKTGMVVMGAWFLFSNGRFYWKLRKNRKEWHIPVGPDDSAGPWRAEVAAPHAEMTTRRKLYLVDEGIIPSPCLFGGAIYLTPAAVEDPDKLWHVLTHEETHARHLDPVWSLLRCVCLTVYWFDPLVWIAAECAKTDCELACDEGALARLGEDERIPYGKTLLSLIPVKKGPGDPLLSATTMTAGKKQLKDRITRIAQNPRQVMAAVLAVAMLVTVAAACTFTGGIFYPETPGPAESAAPSGPVALTGAELEWFNKEFFNSPEPAAGYQYNIRNQFANPINLYDAPENIDLYELFYLEGSAPSDEELKTEFGGEGYESWDDLPCPAYKLTKAEMDEILKANMGLTLADTGEPTGFTWSEEFKAYYWMHGDTNYCGELNFLCGTRETTGGATLVKLYHNSNFAGNSWYCVTLSEQGDGEYWFVSNDMCAQPAIPPVMPSGEPETSISLKELEPYAAPAVTVEAHPNHYAFNYETCYDNWNMDGHSIMVYRADDGVVYAAYVEDDVYYVFLSGLSEERGHVFFYNGLFGRDGFYVDYNGQYDEHTSGPIRDYYYFDANGVLTLLARCETRGGAAACQLDLDGDGTDELVSGRQIFFLRDGLVYEAKLDELLLAQCPELDDWDYESWDVYSRCLYANGHTEYNAKTGAAMWERYFYFDGENILVYRDEKPTVDHMVEGIDAGVPNQVVEQARAYVESILSPQADGTWLHKGWEGYNDYNYVIDDWRIESFPQTSYDQVGDAVIQGWAFNYEMHTPTPEKVTWVGGMYVTEDGWVSPGYPGCVWLFFHNEGGKLTFLRHNIINDMAPGSPPWQQYMEEMAQEHGLDDGKGRSAAARQIQEDLDYFMALDTIHYNYQTGDGESHFAAGSPKDGNAPNRQLYFTDPGTYRWSYALTMPDYQAGDYAKTPSLTISDDTWERYLRFWPGSDYVMSVKPGKGGTWYKVENLADPADTYYEQSNIFNFMRLIYDEAEFSTLQTAALAAEPRLTQDFTDDFKLSDWAKAWATQYELAHGQVSPGSYLAFSWQKVLEVEVANQTDTSMSIWYTLAFVPENETARRYCWAGNTDEFKNFPYPDRSWGVPDGALYYSRVLRLAKADGLWYIEGAGTG